MLAAVLDSAAEHPAFRAPLPVGYARSDADDGGDGGGGGKALVHTVEDCVAEVGRWLASVDADAIAAGLRQRFWSQRPPLLEGQLSQIVELGRLDDASVVVRRHPSVAEPEAGDDRFHLLLGDRELVLPLRVEPAVRRLLDGRPRPVSELADLLDGPSRLVLVRRLVREGVVEVVGAAGDGA